MAESLKSLLNKKLSILEGADESLIDAISQTETSLFSRLKKTIQKFAQNSGVFTPGDTDNQVLLDIQRDVIDAFNSSTLPKKITAFLKNFDEVERLNKEITGTLNDIDLKDFNVSAEKKLIISEISDALNSSKGIRTNIVNPVRRILYRHVTTGSTIQEAEEELRAFIKGHPAKHGHLSRYVRQVSMDAINQYDGAINQKIANQLDMDAFAYVGSLINTSRGNCIDLVQGTGAFADLALAPGTYRNADIPKIIERAQGRPGWNPLTNAGNFYVYRGGFNCRHAVQPMKLTEKRLERMRKIGS